HDAPERDRAQLDAREFSARYREPGLSACALADAPGWRDRHDVGPAAGVPGRLPAGAYRSHQVKSADDAGLTTFLDEHSCPHVCLDGAAGSAGPRQPVSAGGWRD